MLEKCGIPNRQNSMVASFSISTRFMVKFELVFVLTQKKDFSSNWKTFFLRRLILKPTERA